MEGGAYRSTYSDMEGLDFQTKHECWPVLQHDSCDRGRHGRKTRVKMANALTRLLP